MEIRLLLSIICCLFYIIPASAQRQNVYFLKNSGKFVDQRDSADYIRIVKEPDSGSVLYNVTEYYLSGKVKMIGKSSTIENLQLEGQCARFYASGKKESIAMYKQGHLLGVDFEFYPNGILYTQREYIESKTEGGDSYGSYLILACNDSTGKVLVTDGNGYYLGFGNNYKSLEEEGNVKAGLRDGDWKGTVGGSSDPIKFTERYESGKMVWGRAEKKDGTTTNYTLREAPPQFKGGEPAFGRFLSNHIRYPDYAVRNNVQGKVLISFVVEKDGLLTDLKILKNPDDALAAEAIRVLKESPKWVPGMLCGTAVRVQYTVPINFSLGN